MKFFTQVKIGEKRALTPEGYLICYGVPLARTGDMTYGPGETPIEPGPNGTVTVTRDEKAVFDPNFIASLVGKPFTDNHVRGGVNPQNWRLHARGMIFPPYRGAGDQSDLLLADIIVTDNEAIQMVLAGKTEVSVGYEADYEDLGPGLGSQHNLIANHVALVGAGRCGDRCAIGDEANLHTGDRDMQRATTHDKDGAKRAKFFDNLLTKVIKAFKTGDEAEVKKAIAEAKEDADDALPESGGEGDPLHLHIDAGPGLARGMTDEDLEGRFEQMGQAHAKMQDTLNKIAEHVGYKEGGKEGGGESEDAEIEGALEEEAPSGTGDQAWKVADSRYLVDAMQETIAGAEILVPGISIPKFDKNSKPQDSLKVLLGLRRKAMDMAYATPDGKEMIMELNGGKDVDLGKLTQAAHRSLFRSTVAVRKRANRGVAAADAAPMGPGGGMGLKGKMKTPADLNAKNAAFYDKRQPAQAS